MDQIIRQEKWINEMGYINDQVWNRYNTNINDLSEVTLKERIFNLKSIIKSLLQKPSYIK